MVATKKILWALLTLAVLQDPTVATDPTVGLKYTPANPFCGCFKQNAVKTLGSTCFALGEDTFGGKGQIKKHDHLKYIVESCPGTIMPYNYGDNYSVVRDAFNSGSGDWSPVTGTAQVGDIVVTSTDMYMVTALGRYPVLLSDGRKVSKRRNSALWNKVKNHAGSSWRNCAAWTNVTEHIDPAHPRDQCSDLSWTEQSLPSGTPSYWRVVSATTADARGLVPDVRSQYRVFRYNPIDECDSNPCVNGGTCNDLVNSFSCSCLAGYGGTDCMTPIDPCASTPCMNGGTCSSFNNAYTCSCPDGYWGATCRVPSPW